ncbi:MAG: GntR family transcriptional regulator [Desulfobacterales bacterium]|nr:GntR family transcriptional regulator [Desulfobacterales bacterium]
MTKDTFSDVDRSSYKPIYIQVSEMIIEYAREFELKPGDKLPSENKILSMINVSRNTVRQAVDRLVKMNFAVKIRGQGTFIKKNEYSINLDLTQGFEGTLNKLGIKIQNKLIEKRFLKNPVNWVDGLKEINSEKKMLIRRIKLSSGKILALEDRVLPASIVERYSDKELENENINPNLLEKYPDTQTIKMKYYFVSKPLTQNEADLLKIKKGSHFLQRIGEYFNTAEECFMIGRQIFISQINVAYEFERRDDFWMLT